jgi:hypothetical protein
MMDEPLEWASSLMVGQKIFKSRDAGRWLGGRGGSE